MSDNEDGLAKSRRRTLLYTYCSNFITNILTTTYFVGLMLEMGAEDGFINAVTVSITLCGFLQFLSPLLLEHLQRRKVFLISMRAAYHFCYVVLIGAIPFLPLSKNAMLSFFIVTVVIANVINALSVSGVSIWHIQNIPPHRQSDFFTIANVGSQVINAFMNFCAGRIVDTFAERQLSIGDISPKMLAFLILRVFALAVACVELCSLAGIKEHPYEKSPHGENSKKNFKMLLRPLTNAPFMKTVLIYIFYFFISALIGKYFQVYLLDVVQMSYTYISLSGILGLPIVMLLSPVWSYLLRRFSWTHVMPIALTGTAIGYFFNTLITSQTQFFHICCMVFYSSFSVAINIVFTFLPYVNMPKSERTVYISFFTLSGSVASLLGNLVGAWFMSISVDLEYTLFGLTITNYQTLNLIQTVLFLFLALYTLIAMREKNKAFGVQ